MRRDVGRHGRIARKALGQGETRSDGMRACHGHHLVGVMAPDERRQRHHDGLGGDETLCPSEIGLHRFGPDDESGAKPNSVIQGPGDQQEGFRQQQPFSLPRSRRPFMVVDRSVEHGACEPAQANPVLRICSQIIGFRL